MYFQWKNTNVKTQKTTLWQQGSLYYQPKQCPFKQKILQIYHCIMFDSPQNGSHFMICGHSVTLLFFFNSPGTKVVFFCLKKSACWTSLSTAGVLTRFASAKVSAKIVSLCWRNLKDQFEQCLLQEIPRNMFTLCILFLWSNARCIKMLYEEADLLYLVEDIIWDHMLFSWFWQRFVLVQTLNSWISRNGLHTR